MKRLELTEKGWGMLEMMNAIIFGVELGRDPETGEWRVTIDGAEASRHRSRDAARRASSGLCLTLRTAEELAIGKDAFADKVRRALAPESVKGWLATRGFAHE